MALKILYAANNSNSSYHSLKRFYNTYNSYYNIKTAAYSKSAQDLHVNWNLDALLDFTGKRSSIAFTNSNFDLYVREIKRFAPNLIISDFDFYTSYIGLELGILVWQVSPLLLYYGCQQRTNIYKYYANIFTGDKEKYKYITYILNNSDKKFVSSHLCDVADKPLLDNDYEWVRPNFHIKDINEANCGVEFADAYYSCKPTILNINYNDPESIVTSYYNEQYKLSYTKKENLSAFEPTIDSSVLFLSQHLKNLDI